VAAFILVPGAGGNAWDWHLVVPELENRGHRAVAVDLPAAEDRAGLRAYADTIVDAIGGQRDVVVAALSFGAFSAPLACERVPVSLLVLLNPMIPTPGEPFNDWWTATGQGEAFRAVARDLGITERELQDDEVLYYHDVSPDKVAEAKVLPARQSSTPLSEPWPLRRWPDVPTRVLIGRDDRVFPEAFQRRVARERLGLEIDVVPGGHMAAISHPAEVADRLDRYAAEVIRPG
jgi:pimeloyl-ACP methyl ester carboxylesterase